MEQGHDEALGWMHQVVEHRTTVALDEGRPQRLVPCVPPLERLGVDRPTSAYA